MKKRILPLALALVMLLCVTASALTPRWNATDSFRPHFSISGSTATCKLSIITAGSSATVSGTVILYQVNGDEYTELASWNVTSPQFSKTYSPVSPGDYEMYYSITVSSSLGNDTITDIMTATKY